MYALRIYKSNKDQTQHTNTVEGIFKQKDKEGTVHLFHYSNKAKEDWALCKLRIWPANDKKHTVYPLPDGKRLFLFAKIVGEKEIKLLASVFEVDDYISFEPLDLDNPNDELFYLIVSSEEEDTQIKATACLP